MTISALFTYINDTFLAVPTTILFFGTALFLTYKTKFVQFRMFSRFIQLVTGTIQHTADKQQALNPFHAAFTSMGTTMGMGNVIGPSVAIFTGGPGALFWLLIYVIFGCVTKFAEVVFALRTRTIDADGHIIGGPLRYLTQVHPLLALWYGTLMLFLFASWSSLQANTLAALLSEEGVSVWFTAVNVTIFLTVVLQGGAKRVSKLASRAVPIMFCMYVSVALYILLSNIPALISALILIKNSVLSPCAFAGGFCGSAVFQAMHAGLYQGVFITEAGIGTTSIPHSLANTNSPIDQGLLALYSTISDFLLVTLSGLLVLVTGVWNIGEFRSTFIYEAFKMHVPGFGSYVLLASLSLFIITTIVGNSFNGIHICAGLFPKRLLNIYTALMIITVFAGSLVSAPLVWEGMKLTLACAAIPNVLGLIILAIRRPQDITI